MSQDQPLVSMARLARAFSFRIGCGSIVAAFLLAVLVSFISEALIAPVFFISLVLFWLGAVFTDSPNSGRCPYCKRLVRFDASVCPRCASPLPIPMQPSSAPRTTAGPSAEQGSPPPSGASFGRDTPIPPQVAQPPEIIEPTQRSAGRFCLKCGVELVEGAQFCGTCGTARGTTS
jgi:RNA polymerase subunit RPABC4/transcription elongation factor Spt4